MFPRFQFKPHRGSVFLNSLTTAKRNLLFPPVSLHDSRMSWGFLLWTAAIVAKTLGRGLGKFTLLSLSWREVQTSAVSSSSIRKLGSLVDGYVPLCGRFKRY